MAFLTVSDSSGDMEAVAFPNVYKRYLPLLVQGQYALLAGKVEMREGQAQFVIQQVFNLEDWLKERPSSQSTLYLQIISENQDEKLLNRLNQLLKGNKGETAVIIHYEISRKTVRLSNENKIEPKAFLLESLKELLGPNNVVLRE